MSDSQVLAELRGEIPIGSIVVLNKTAAQQYYKDVYSWGSGEGFLGIVSSPRIKVTDPVKGSISGSFVECLIPHLDEIAEIAWGWDCFEVLEWGDGEAW